MSSWGSRNCKQQVQLRQINRSPDRSRHFLWKFINISSNTSHEQIVEKLGCDILETLFPKTNSTDFSKPLSSQSLKTNSTKRIHQKVSNCHSRFCTWTSPKQILYVPNCRSRFETFRKQDSSLVWISKIFQKSLRKSTKPRSEDIPW